MNNKPLKKNPLFDRKEMKNQIFKSQSNEMDDAFMVEAKEGWNSSGEASFDRVLDKIEKRIDHVSMLSSKDNKFISIFSKSKLRAMLALAASVVVALILVWNFPQKQDPQALFASYYKPISPIESQQFRGGEDNSSIEATHAAEAFEKEDYENAILYYRALLNSQPHNSKYTLFLGMSYLSSGKPKAAIQLYNNYQPKGDSFDEDIHWYLALAYLQTGEINTARIIFEEISKKNNYYSPTAAAILKKLN